MKRNLDPPLEAGCQNFSFKLPGNWLNTEGTGWGFKAGGGVDVDNCPSELGDCLPGPNCDDLSAVTLFC